MFAFEGDSGENSILNPSAVVEEDDDEEAAASFSFCSSSFSEIAESLALLSLDERK